MKKFNIQSSHSNTETQLFLSVILILFLAFCFIPSQKVLAANSKGLTVSPLRNEINISPGTSQSGIITITNSTDGVMTVSINAEEFSVINQQYDYAFTAESELSKWVRVESPDIDLTAGETKKIPYLIGVPISAEPGGRYISLFASTATDLSDSSVESRQRIASLLYINVLGDVTRSGDLVSLNSPWLIGGESEWSAAIQNKGTTHFRSRYNVKINDIIFNNEVVNMTGDALILPGTVRLVTDKLPNLNWPGIYKISYNIGLGDYPAKNEIRILIYLHPLAIAIIIVLIIFIIFNFMRKKSNKHKL